MGLQSTNLIAILRTLTDNSCCRHLSLIFAVIRYGFSYISFNYYSRIARFSYRLTFLSAALTYGIVVYKTLRARSKAGAKAPQSPLALIADENVQYLGELHPCPLIAGESLLTLRP